MEETEPKLGFGHLTSIQLHYQQYLRNLVDILSEIQWNSNGLPIGEEPNPEDLKRLQTKFETMLQGLQQSKFSPSTRSEILKFSVVGYF